MEQTLDQRPTMESLPRDIIQCITDPLKFHDKQALRSTSRRLRAAVSIYAISRKCEHLVTNNVLKMYPGLRALNLDDNPHVDDDALRTLTNLTTLYVSKSASITDRSVQLLTNLRELYVYRTPNITDQSIARLRNLEYLRTTTLDGSSLSGLRKLTYLEVMNWNQGGTAAIGNLPNLKVLCASTDVTDSVVKRLTNLKHLCLQDHAMRGGQITEKCVQALINSGVKVYMAPGAFWARDYCKDRGGLPVWNVLEFWPFERNRL